MDVILIHIYFLLANVSRVAGLGPIQPHLLHYGHHRQILNAAACRVRS
jgi:hypothetical protein